jgi:dihydrofolate synthase/folylpolyglutamate synthase
MLHKRRLVSPRRILPGPEYALHVLDFLGNPQNVVPVVHVVGTSGKAAVSRKIAALLERAGRNVAVGGSPRTFMVRPRAMGRAVGEGAYHQALREFLGLVERANVPLTNAELATTFHYWYFARLPIDVVVMQSGMGGVQDPSNVVSRADKICVITDVTTDHAAQLGPTLADVAEHKAGIIQPGNAVFCYRMAPEVMDVIQRRAQQKQADLHTHASISEIPHAVAAWVLGQER